MNSLPLLITEDLIPTRNYVQDVAKVLGSLQRAYIEPNDHDWHHGLTVSMRGISTQQMIIAGQPIRATIDLVKHKVRLGNTNWLLEEFAAPEILNNIKVWLVAHGQSAELEQPEFTSDIRQFDGIQAARYAETLWWLEQRFKNIKNDLNGGLTSPILLYPHHFDLAFSWFPHDDDQQLTMGFSTGDESVRDPYLYITAYPEPAGFSGAILAYSRLQVAQEPSIVLDDFAALLMEV